MKLHVCSDLHLEISNLRPHKATDSADVIVLAGDIWSGANGIHWARSTWPHQRIVMVAGNHEFYHRNIDETRAEMKAVAKAEGVDFLDNDEVVINGTRFLGATLWTDFQLFGENLREQCMFDGGRCLNDFRLIWTRDGDYFSVLDSIRLHEESVRWLEMKLRREPFDGSTVVVTHHAPSFGSVVPRYARDVISACFASKLDHLLGFSDLWLHGHMHDSLDYSQDGTRVICNPRGYCRFEGGQENGSFDPSLLVEVSQGRAEILTDEAARKD